MKPRRMGTGTRLPSRAPIAAPITDPIAISATASQATLPKITNSTAAARFTAPANTFFNAFVRDQVTALAPLVKTIRVTL